MEFFWIIGLPILEGYGLTETIVVAALGGLLIGTIVTGDIDAPIAEGDTIVVRDRVIAFVGDEAGADASGIAAVIDAAGATVTLWTATPGSGGGRRRGRRRRARCCRAPRTRRRQPRSNNTLPWYSQGERRATNPSSGESLRGSRAEFSLPTGSEEKAHSVGPRSV